MKKILLSVSAFTCICVIWYLAVNVISNYKNSNDKPAHEASVTCSSDEIPIGLLFSTTGTSAISEQCMLDAAIMAIDEINASGGIGGKQIVYFHEDYASNPNVAQNKIKKLIEENGVIATIGCYTSASRKATLSTIKNSNSLLIYPTYTEGEELADNVIYTGAMPNQQSHSYLLWLLQHCGKKAFLLGSDYVFPITCNKQAKLLIDKYGGEVVGEEYVTPGHIEFDEILDKIKKTDADFIYCNLIGDSMTSFYQAYYDYGLSPDNVPICSITTDEMTLSRLNSKYTEGHYSSMNYYSCLGTDENEAFTQNFNKLYPNSPITCLAETTYTSVYLLKKAIEKLERSYILPGTQSYNQLLYQAFTGISFNSPEGNIRICSNHCLARKSRFAVIHNNEFLVIYESPGNIIPEPFSGL